MNEKELAEKIVNALLLAQKFSKRCAEVRDEMKMTELAHALAVLIHYDSLIETADARLIKAARDIIQFQHERRQ